MPPFNEETYIDARFDQPRHDGIPRCYVICCAPRVGSWLLCSLLQGTGRMGVPGEYFNARDGMPQLAERFGLVQDGKVALDAYVDALLSRRTTPNGVFGFKLQHWMLEALTPGRILARRFPGARYVYLDREDMLQQGVSYEIARQTGRWSSFKDGPEPVYDDYRLRTAIRFVLSEKQGWEAFFAEQRISPLRLTYEALVADPAAACRAVGALVGVTLDGPFSLERTGFRRQRSALDREWLKRLRAHAIERQQRKPRA